MIASRPIPVPLPDYDLRLFKNKIPERTVGFSTYFPRYYLWRRHRSHSDCSARRSGRLFLPTGAGRYGVSALLVGDSGHGINGIGTADGEKTR